MPIGTEVAPAALPVARFSVEQYHRMIAAGAFTEDDPIELIEGWVVRKTPKGPSHAYATGRLEDFLRAHLPGGAHVRNQEPITLARSEPEPDLCLARGERDAYRRAHPGPADALLVVEVADSSLATDRVKAKTYGDAGIPQFWLVNLPERCVEVHTLPSALEPSGYARTLVVREPGELRLVIDGVELGALAVAAILP